MTFLLDVNVLTALIDPAHVNHDETQVWFEREGRHSWATCPLTENGVLRIIGHHKYPNTPEPPSIVADIVRKLRQAPGHLFWGDTISLLDEVYTDVSQLLTSSQVTDSISSAWLHPKQASSRPSIGACPSRRRKPASPPCT